MPYRLRVLALCEFVENVVARVVCTPKKGALRAARPSLTPFLGVQTTFADKADYVVITYHVGQR